MIKYKRQEVKIGDITEIRKEIIEMIGEMIGIKIVGEVEIGGMMAGEIDMVEIAGGIIEIEEVSKEGEAQRYLKMQRGQNQRWYLIISDSRQKTFKVYSIRIRLILGGLISIKKPDIRL
jgi:hypothetical protein